MINPGLVPWVLQEYRPKRAHLRFHHPSITLLFDALALPLGIINEYDVLTKMSTTYSLS